MDLLTMRTRLRKRVGNPTTTDVPDVDLNEAINSAYSDVAVRYKFHKVRRLCTFNTVIGQAKYGLPVDCFAVLRVRDNTNKKNLTKAGDREYASRTNTTNGKPGKYIRYRDWITVEPPPDGVFEFELFYKSKPVDLVADADQPVLPTAWHEGIIRLARYYHFDTVGDLPKAAVALQVFNFWTETMPLEFDDEAEAIDSGVEIPTLHNAEGARLDFDHSE